MCGTEDWSQLPCRLSPKHTVHHQAIELEKARERASQSALILREQVTKTRTGDEALTESTAFRRASCIVVCPWGGSCVALIAIARPLVFHDAGTTASPLAKQQCTTVFLALAFLDGS